MARSEREKKSGRTPSAARAPRQPRSADVRRRLKFDELITSLSTQFINLPLNRIDDEITNALALIGEQVGADRSYVFLLSPDGQLMDNTHEWAADGIEPQQQNLRGLPTTEFPWWVARLRQLESIYVPRVADMPPEAHTEQEILQAQAIQSVLVVPMVLGGALIGFVGFDAVRSQREWDTVTLGLLRIVGEIFANALARKEAEQSIQLYLDMFRNMPIGVLALRLEDLNDARTLRIIAANPASTQALGIDLANDLGRTLLESFPSVYQTPYPEIYAQVIRTREAVDLGEVEYGDERISLGTYSVKAFPLPRNAVAIAFENITERRRAQIALQESEERFRRLADATFEGIVLVDQGRIVDANETFAHMFGYTLSEVLGRSPLEFVTPEMRALVQERIATHYDKAYETHGLKKDGTPFVIEASGKPIMYQGRKVRVTAVRDISARKQAEEQLRFHNSLLEALTEASLDGVLVVAADRHWLTYNRRFLQMWNVPSEVLRERSSERALRSVADQVLNPEQFIARVQYLYDHPDEVSQDEINLKHGRVYERYSAPVKGADGTYHGRVWFYRDVSARKRSERQLRRSHEQLRALSSHLQSAREEERARIAREIHDELGQVLTALKMDLSMLGQKVAAGEQPPPRELMLGQIQAMAQLLDDTIRTVRQIISNLRPEMLEDLGLKAAIEWQVQEFQSRTQIECQFSSNLGQDVLNEERAMAVFRILQESLTNVARHAQATRVNVQLNQEGKQLILRVHDNGRGISEAEMSKNNSFGLLGIRERALLLGGSIDIHGAPNRGTTVTVQIPL